MSWHDARRECFKDSRDLASVHSAEENDALFGLIDRMVVGDFRVFLGGHDILAEVRTGSFLSFPILSLNYGECCNTRNALSPEKKSEIPESQTPFRTSGSSIRKSRSAGFKVRNPEKSS